MVHVTHHAITRAMERVPGIRTEAQARALLSAPSVERAAAFGARYVRLGTGQRIVIEQGSVTTVLPRETAPWRLGSFGDRVRQHARGWARFDQQEAHQ